MHLDAEKIVRKECIPDEELGRFYERKICNDNEIGDIIEHVMHCSRCVFKLYKLWEKDTEGQL